MQVAPSAGRSEQAAQFRHAACSLAAMASLWRTVRPGVALLAVAVLGLNLLDAALTLLHVERGAVELNPLMQQLLAEGPLAFVAGKHTLVGACVVAVAAHPHQRAAIRALSLVVLPAYAMIAIYQVALFVLVE